MSGLVIADVRGVIKLDFELFLKPKRQKVFLHYLALTIGH